MEGSQDIIMEQQVQPATWTLLLDERQHLHKHYTRMIQEVTGPGSALALRVQELEKAHGAKEYELRHLRTKQNQLELDMTRKEQSWELSLQQSRKAFESEIETLKATLCQMEGKAVADLKKAREDAAAAEEQLKKDCTMHTRNMIEGMIASIGESERALESTHTAAQRELERLAHGQDQQVNETIATFAQGLNDVIMRDVDNWEMKFQQLIDTLGSEKERIANEIVEQDAKRAWVAGDAGDCLPGDRPEPVGHRPAPRLQEIPMHDSDPSDSEEEEPGEDGDPRTASITWSSGALRRAARKLGLEDLDWLGRPKRDLAGIVARVARMKHG